MPWLYSKKADFGKDLDELVDPFNFGILENNNGASFLGTLKERHL